MKPSLVLKLGLALVLAGGAVAWLLAQKPAATVAVVHRGQAVNAVPATVSVRADYAMELRSENGGRVKSSTLVVGAQVHAGDVVVQIDDTDLQIELERLTNECDAARQRQTTGSANEVALATARDDLDKATRQADSGTFARSDLDKLRRAAEQLEDTVALEKIDRGADLKDWENKLKVQRRLIEKTSIVAPVDGKVATVDLRPGALIPAGASLGTLLADARVVEASISEENFAGVAAGQRARVKFLGYGDEEFDATVAAVLPTTDPATQRYTVRLDVKIAPERLVPGLSGEASVILGEHAGALLAPRRALTGDYLLLVRDGRVVQQRVRRGFADMQSVELLDGAKEGDLVITDNLNAFHAGDRVAVAQP